MAENKGFSLVELIVSMAILVIAGTAIFGFFSYATSQFNRGTEEGSLQIEAQTAQSRMQELLLRTTEAMYVTDEAEGDALHLVNDDGTSIAISHSGTQLLYTETGASGTVSEAEVFASYITSWDVSLYDEDGAEISDFSQTDAPAIAKVEITLSMQNGNRRYNSNEVVSMRQEIVAYQDEE